MIRQPWNRQEWEAEWPRAGEHQEYPIELGKSGLSEL